MHVHKAYLSAKGGPSILNLTHDVKRCMSDCQQKAGQINILSTQGTTAVTLIEGDAGLQKEYLEHLQAQFAGASQDKVDRRSHTGPNCYHLMAAAVGLSLTLSFEDGRLLTSPFHEVVALDFEPVPGRREFVITVSGAAAPPAQGMPPGGMRMM